MVPDRVSHITSNMFTAYFSCTFFSLHIVSVEVPLQILGQFLHKGIFMSLFTYTLMKYRHSQ